MRIIWLISSILCRAKQVFYAEWKAGECESRPEAMYLFEMSDIDAMTPPNGEVWPPSYHWFMQYIYPAKCNQFDIPGAACCQVSLLPDQSGASSAVIEFAESVTSNILLQKMNGAAYCRLKALDSSALYGYREMYVLEGSSSAGVSCSANSVTVSTLKGNTPLISTISLDDSDKNVVTVIGSLLVRKLVIAQGSQVIKFTNHSPSRLLVLRFAYPLEITFLLFGLLCLLALGYAMHFFALKFIATRSYSFAMHSVAQLLFMLDMILMMVYFYVPFQTDTGLALYTAFLFFVDNIATLFAVTVTLRTIVQILSPPDKIRYAIYGSLILVHLVLAGANYGVLFAMYDSDAYEDYLMWYPLHVYWILFMFLVNSIPLGMLCFRVLSNDKAATYGNIKDTLFGHPKFAAYIGINVIVCMLYMRVEWQTTFAAEELGSDRNVLAMEIFKWVAIVAHVVVQCWAIEYIRSVLDNSRVLDNLRKYARLNTPGDAGVILLE